MKLVAQNQIKDAARVTKQPRPRRGRVLSPADRLQHLEAGSLLQACRHTGWPAALSCVLRVPVS